MVKTANQRFNLHLKWMKKVDMNNRWTKLLDRGRGIVIKQKKFRVKESVFFE
jgi:hypothetical protein